MKIGYITSLLVAAPAAMVIATAPSAGAAPSTQSCTDTTGATNCQTPGNAQIYASPRSSGFPLKDFAPEPPPISASGGVDRDVNAAAKS